MDGCTNGDDGIMTAEEIIAQLPFTPNPEQRETIEMLAWFCSSQTDRSLFLLRGYAGTGKTSLVSALLKCRRLNGLQTTLLAPTGRAAKVLSAYSGQNAYTIHKCIYRQQAAGMERFSLADNLAHDVLFIVDEASMIGNDDGGVFGSGCLLDDLMQFIYCGLRCSLLLLGDTAQLPPVGQNDSKALDRQFLAGYGLNVVECTLTQVARQALQSGILYNATMIRQALGENNVTSLYQFDYKGFPDVVSLNGRDFVETLTESYNDVGLEQTMVVTRTNRRAALYNQGIRARILWREEKVENGDRIMVTRNNYFFTEAYEKLDFIANGDILEVVRVAHERELYGFRFADMSLRSVDYDWEIDVVALIDSLDADTADNMRTMQNSLFERIAEDYPELANNRRKLVKAVLESPYYNALQFKHAYAATCHKCQGGQWKHVYVDTGNLLPEQINTDYYRWLYTAVTRATEKLYILQTNSR